MEVVRTGVQVKCFPGAGTLGTAAGAESHPVATKLHNLREVAKTSWA